MLLLFQQGTAGTATIGASDTISLQATAGLISDFFIQTLDDIDLSLGDISAIAVRVDRSDFPNLHLGESAGVGISGVQAKAVTDTVSIAANDAALAAVVAVVLPVTDTASLSVSDASTVDIGQIAVAVTDTISIQADSIGLSSTVADVARTDGDDIFFRLEDRADIVESQPAAAIRFEPKPDQIRFSVQ